MHTILLSNFEGGSLQYETSFIAQNPTLAKMTEKLLEFSEKKNWKLNLPTSVQNLKFDISKRFCAIRFHCTECFCAINTSEFIWFISENYCHKFPKYFGQKFKRNKMLLFSKLVLWALKWDRFPGGLCSALIQLRAILNFNNA